MVFSGNCCVIIQNNAVHKSLVFINEKLIGILCCSCVLLIVGMETANKAITFKYKQTRANCFHQINKVFKVYDNKSCLN